MPVSDFRNIPEYIRKRINTPKKAAKFAYNSTTDEKRDLLSYLGITFFWTFAAVDKITSKQYFETLRQFQTSSPSKAIQEIIDGQIYVTADKTHVALLSRVSQNIQTGAYTKNLELSTVGNFLNKWPRKLVAKVHEESDEIIESAHRVNRMIAASIRKSRHSDYLLSVTAAELDILLFLGFESNKYTDHERLLQEFAGEMTAKKVTTAETGLLKKMLIQPHPDWRRKQFTITKLGLRTLHQFRDTIIKAA